jgi:endonuclease YncB( thermonuclease family)
MKILSLSLAALMVGFAIEANAAPRDDVMPPPKSAPRIPVDRQLLDKEFEGSAKAIDGERLSVDGKEVRLFGIVTPALGSGYGPKSRQQLDRMLQGNVLCKITDVDKEGVPVAFCGTVNVPDMSYEMLRQGWAMVDRKSLKGNGLSEIYGKVEREAQAANRGIFAPTPMTTVIPLTNPGNSVTVAAAPEPTVTDAVASFMSPSMAVAASSPSSASKLIDEQNNATAAAAAPPVAPATDAEAIAAAVASAPVATGAASSIDSGMSFIERYQVLLGTVFLFLAACIYASVPAIRERARTSENRRSVAAALRGELMAARHICRTKSRELANYKKADGALRPSQLWPRIRTVVYQANVGSIGLLGSELARRVASVYGQCVDYAAFFQQAPASRVPAPKAVSETLSILGDHMDVVLDSLAQVEETGKPFMIEVVEYTALPAPAAEQAEVVEEENLEEEIVQKKSKPGLKQIAQSMSSMFGKNRQPQPVAEEEEDEDEFEDGEENMPAVNRKSRAA